MQINLLSRLKFQVFRALFWTNPHSRIVFCESLNMSQWLQSISKMTKLGMILMCRDENFSPNFKLQSFFIQSYSVYFRLFPIYSDQFRSLLVQGNLNHSRIGLTRVSLRVYTSLHPSYTRDWLGRRFGSFLTGWSEHVAKTWYWTFLMIHIHDW